MDFHVFFYAAASFCLASLLLKFIQLYQRRQRLVRSLENFPGPPKHWFYGHTNELGRVGELHTMQSWSEKYPFGHSLWYGYFLGFLNIYDPDYAKAVYSRGDPKALDFYGFFLPWIGKGLLVLDGPKWFQHRRLLTPAFHSDILKSYVPLMVDSIQVMLDKWEKLISKDKSLDIFPLVGSMTLDSMLKCLFSYDSNCQHHSENEYVQQISVLSCLMQERIQKFLYHNDLIYHLTPHGHRFFKACKIAHRHTEKVIQERKALLKDERELEKIQKKRHLDFLDVLLCAKIFDPERFSPENTSHQHPYAFLAFAAGPRNCIGQQFALMELKLAVALTLLHFQVSPDPANLPLEKPQLAMRSWNGMHLYFKKT